MVGKTKAHELRNSSEKELLKKLEEYQNELASLRVAKVTGGAASKLAKIKIVRKSIARILTVYNQKRKEEARKEWDKKKYKPIDIRQKKTRAKRRKIPAGFAKPTVKETKKQMNIKTRRYAVKA
ncbi:unnamed protein product [Vitrella brassicaformis CCMP3155]|uniref:60S ribosomal protein L35 n=1 Tax=Vitrella brassicaformis (strain CCMP3155) TaxID=1169540 RepID=A0A0G4FB00_VITBC|nr:unnamed protein product [Vitrella brassicaformis CCMP3155]|mmetsp:Transcript_51116/g.128305  ORF Transcript_51116/g.128305 Transcript_51116/m.128305 type:complete len:124 (-) Transcript_51116:184-555(-)|eukprot:CEM10072.1 unnamed protein product [Vitrella brassicaformis CCMP3155]